MYFKKNFLPHRNIDSRCLKEYKKETRFSTHSPEAWGFVNASETSFFKFANLCFYVLKIITLKGSR